MPPYGMQPPTGYSMKATAWVNSSALLGRMNFALALTAGKLKGIQVNSLVNSETQDSEHPPTAASATLAYLENDLLHGDVSRQTHDTIAARLQDPQISRAHAGRSGTRTQRGRDCGFAAGIARVSEEIAFGS